MPPKKCKKTIATVAAGSTPATTTTTTSTSTTTGAATGRKEKQKALDGEKDQGMTSKGDAKTQSANGDVVEEPVKCAVCEQIIIEGDEQALFCEGACQQWVHRYCAGIPASLFVTLSTSSAPFQCYACCQQIHANEIAKLTDIVSNLKKEVSELRNDLSDVVKADKLSHSFAEVVSGTVSTDHVWSVGAGDRAGGVARSGRSRDSHSGRGRGRGRGGGSGGGGRGGNGGMSGRGGGNGGGRGGNGGMSGRGVGRGGNGGMSGSGGGRGGNGGMSGHSRDGDCPVSRHLSQLQLPSVISSDHPRTTSELPTKSISKEKVLGARRVWGTMSICTTSAVQNAIKRFCGIDSVQVKRKHKIRSNGSNQWWFVLHDNEATLCVLESNWSLIEVQTSWKLESCFKPAVSELQADSITESSVNRQSACPAVDSVGTNCVAVARHEPQQVPDNKETSGETDALSSAVDSVDTICAAVARHEPQRVLDNVETSCEAGVLSSAIGKNSPPKGSVCSSPSTSSHPPNASEKST